MAYQSPYRAMSETGTRRVGASAGGSRQKYFLDDAGRNLMRAVYANPEYGTISQSIDYLVNKLQVSREVVKRWAGDMGLTNVRDDLWSADDLAYLQKHFERMSVKKIAEHLGRSENAVRIKARRLKYHRASSDGYSVQGLADVLGCDAKKVMAWVQRGWLHTTWDKSLERRQYHITSQEVRRFIIAYPGEIDHRRVDWCWLLDILVGSEEIGKIRAKRGA